MPAYESAVLVEIPEAEIVVGALRDLHDPAAGAGVPAHVTVLYPFLPASALTDGVRGALRTLFAPLPPLDYRFDRVARFDDGTIYLVPDQAAPFRALTGATHDRFPEHPPYGGAFAEVIPHLTVGASLRAPTADEVEAAASAALERHGPVVGRASDVVLMVADAGGRWSVDSRHPLRGAAG